MFRAFTLALCLTLAGLIAWAAGLGPEVTASAGRLFIAGADGTVHVALIDGRMLAYPAWADVAGLVAALALAALACRRAFKLEPFSLVSAGRGVLAMILATAAAALSTRAPDILASQGLRLSPAIDRAVLAALIVLATVASFALAGIGRARYFSAFAGAFALGLILALGLGQIAPTTAVVADWTLLFAAALAAALALRWDAAWSRRSAQIFTALFGALALAQLLYLVQPFGADVSGDGLAAFTALAALALFPLLWPRPRQVASLAQL
jgi:hypothetical protein